VPTPIPTLIMGNTQSSKAIKSKKPQPPNSNKPRKSRKAQPSKTKKPKKIGEFHLFSQLPTELRLLIWDFSLNEPRIIDVFALNRNAPNQTSNPGSTGIEKRQYVCLLHSPISLLSVCWESRLVALHGHGIISAHALAMGNIGTGTTLESSLLRFEREVRNHWFNRRELSKGHDHLPGLTHLRTKFNFDTDLFYLHETSWSPSEIRWPLQLLDDRFTEDVLPKIKLLAIPPGTDRHIHNQLKHMELSNLELIIFVTSKFLPLPRRKCIVFGQTGVLDLKCFREDQGWKMPEVRIIRNRARLERG
jgi:hypothetical protein